MNYDEEMMEDYPEPTPPEEMPPESETTPEPDLSLEQFMDLTEAERAAIWANLMSVTQETKSDTSQIIELVTPKGSSEDPLLPLIEQMVEISMRTEDKIDLEAAMNKYRFDHLSSSLRNLHKKMGAIAQHHQIDLMSLSLKSPPELESYLSHLQKPEWSSPDTSSISQKRQSKTKTFIAEFSASITVGTTIQSLIVFELIVQLRRQPLSRKNQRSLLETDWPAHGSLRRCSLSSTSSDLVTRPAVVDPLSIPGTGRT